MENNTVVYRHVRLDTNEVFYVGIGNDKRPYQKTGRNKWWHKVVGKTEYRIDVIFDNMTYSEACEKEKEFITLYGRRDLGLGTLVNLTNGGDTTIGYRHTEETRRKMSESSRNPSKETRKKLREAAKRRIVSIETRLKMSKSSSGGTSGMKGKKHTEETKRKMSEKQLKKPIIQLDINNNLIRNWVSSAEVEKVLGFCPSSIIKVCKGKLKSHKGYKWKYKDGY